MLNVLDMQEGLNSVDKHHVNFYGLSHMICVHILGMFRQQKY